MTDKETLSDQIGRDLNFANDIAMKHVRGFIQDETFLIIQLECGDITMQEFWEKRNKLAGNKLANNNPQDASREVTNVVVNKEQHPEVPILCECGHTKNFHIEGKLNKGKCTHDNPDYCSCKKFKSKKEQTDKQTDRKGCGGSLEYVTLKCGEINDFGDVVLCPACSGDGK